MKPFQSHLKIKIKKIFLYGLLYTLMTGCMFFQPAPEEAPNNLTEPVIQESSSQKGSGSEGSIQKQATKTEAQKNQFQNKELSQKITRIEKLVAANDQRHQRQIRLLEKTITLLEKGIIDTQESIKQQPAQVVPPVASTTKEPTSQPKVISPTEKNDLLTTTSPTSPQTTQPTPSEKTAPIPEKENIGVEIDTPDSSKAITNVSLRPKIQNPSPTLPTDPEEKEKLSSDSVPLLSVEEENFVDPDLGPPKYPLRLKVVPGAKRLYNEAYKSFTRRNYNQAVLMFTQFIQRYPNDRDADNSQYWIGHSQMDARQFLLAEQSFRKVLKTYPHGDTAHGYKTPDAIFQLGKIYLEREDILKAKYYFKDILDRFPDTRSAVKARSELESLEKMKKQ